MHRIINHVDYIKILSKPNNWLRLHGYPLKRGPKGWRNKRYIDFPPILKDPYLEVTVPPEVANRLYQRNENSPLNNIDYLRLWKGVSKCFL